VALPPRVYYRMDATVPVNRPLIWPVDALLLPWRLDANKVGIFGWVGTEGERTSVPLQVVPSGAPQPAGPVTIVLPDGPTAVLRVEVAAKERHRDRWSTLSIRMIRPGLP